MFLDRHRETEALERRAAGARAELLLLYGRRRVGKSELLDRFAAAQGGLRLQAREEPRTAQLRMLSSALAAHFHDPVLASNPFSGWDPFFTYLAERSSRRFVLALDEFPFLVESDPALPSILQSHWDGRLRKTRIFLVLCGSSIGMMEDLMGARSPLYGRRTGQMLLRPLRFGDALPRLGKMRQAVEAWAVFGGTPAYLLEFDPSRGLRANLRDKALDPERALFRDVEFVLRQEVREPRAYFAILESIAKGNTRMGGIINDTGLDKGTVGKYLAVLGDLHLVEREVPVTESRPEKSRRGIYRIADHYFRFWFRFVYPNLQELEQGRRDRILDTGILPRLGDFTAPVFERVALEALERMGETGTLPVKPVRLGRWWDRNAEIDAVALGEDGALFCEVKWSDGVDAPGLVRDLEGKASATGLGGARHYAVVARSFRRRAPGTLNLDLEDLGRLFRAKPASHP
jgi:hypothetical protein